MSNIDIKEWQIGEDTYKFKDETARQQLATKQDAITQVTASADTNVGTPSVTPTWNNGTLDFAFHNIKGGQGVKGDTVILGNEEEYTLYNTTGNKVDGAMTQDAVTRELENIKVDRWETINMGARVSGITTDASTSKYKSALSHNRLLKKQFLSGDVIKITRETVDPDGTYFQVVASTNEPDVDVAYTSLAGTNNEQAELNVVMPFDGWLGVRYYVRTVEYTPVIKKAIIWKNKVNDALDSINALLDENINVELALFDEESLKKESKRCWWIVPQSGVETWKSSSAYGYLLQIVAYRGDTMVLTARSGKTATYAFVHSYPSSQPSPVVFTDGYTKETISGGQSSTLSVPSTANYLYIEYQSSSGNVTFPTELKFIGGLKNVVESLNSKTEELSEKLTNDNMIVLSSLNQENINSYNRSWYINPNSLNWGSSSSWFGKTIPISDWQGKTIEITANDNAKTRYAFQKSSPSSNQSNIGTSAEDYFCDDTTLYEITKGDKETVIIPNDANYLFVEYRSNSTTITCPSLIRILDTMGSTIDSLNAKVNTITTIPCIHVNAVSGDNNNDGLSASTAVATIGKALSIGGQEARIIMHGNYYGSVSITNKRRIVLSNAEGEIARIIRGHRITLEDIEGENGNYDEQTGVYSVDMSQSADLTSTFAKATTSGMTPENYWIYQHDTPDTSTLIENSERHPMQRGKVYRCGSARMTRYTSLEALQASSSSPSYYFDYTTNVLYFKIADGSNLTDNPVVLPLYGDRGIYANNSEVHLTGIDVLYGSIDIVKCVNSSLTDCSASYVYGGQLGGACGAIMWRSTRNITFTRCEAARCVMGTSAAGGTGDGFNAHLTNDDTATGQQLKRMTATLVDCWGHDNMDEGVSDHGRSEVTYIGGLYEHNGTGAAPALGSASTFYNVTFRSNDTEGLRCGANISQTVEQVGVGTCSIAYNCMSENNGGRGYEVSNGKAGRPNTLTLIGCKAVNNTGTGFYSSSATNSPLYLYDCSYSGNATIVANAAAIKNTTTVTQ